LELQSLQEPIKLRLLTTPNFADDVELRKSSTKTSSKDKIMKKNSTGMRLCKMTQNIKLIREEVEVS
jgi:hypothetical protein